MENQPRVKAQKPCTKTQKQIDVKARLDKNALIVFTDGSCTGYGTERACASAGAYFPFDRQYVDISKACGVPATNQRAELSAILFVL
jgi:hypothetical protein